MSNARNTVDLAVSKYGKLDIMFNNARVGNLETNTVDVVNENLKKVMDINVFGGFFGAKHAAKYEKLPGSLLPDINITSSSRLYRSHI
ncbi:hypothetical protein DITRI_Ditri05aG0080600 [Diplodiscus trichospermus]